MATNGPSLSGAYAKVFGYDSPAEIMEVPVAERYADLDDRVRLLEDLVGGAAVTRELRGRRKDGSTIWVLMQAVEMNRETSTDREGMLIDITDRRRQAAAAQEAVALREVAALAAAAAHEINNPLTIVQVQTELASFENADARRIEQVRAAVQRISEIVARMSRTTRLEKLSVTPDIPPMLDIRRSGATKEPSSGRGSKTAGSRLDACQSTEASTAAARSSGHPRTEAS